MPHVLRLSLAAAVLGTGAILGAAPAAAVEPQCPADFVFSAYSQTCLPAGAVGDAGATLSNPGEGSNRGEGSGQPFSRTESPSVLPFTGDEVALLAAAGAAAVALGTGLVVVGGRRRRAAATPA